MNVPKLRFPEFRGAGEWEVASFESIYDFKVTNSFPRDMLNYEAGLIKNIHYGDIHTKFSTLFDMEKEFVPFINSSVSVEKIKQESYCIEGDMIFADASEDLADVGKSIELVNLNNERLVSGLHTILARQRQSKMVVGFGGYLFKSQRMREQIQKESQGAKVLGLSSRRLAGVEVCHPSDKKEQQKIANCLSSLDDLVTAETQKLAALKDHKKGLMQQFFPQTGEITPRLRFAEFLDDWNIKKLGELGIFMGGGTPSKAVPEYWQGDIPWISSSDISEDDIHSISITKFINTKSILESATKIIPAGSVLFVSRVGTGKLAINDKDLCTSQDFTNFISKKIHRYFLGYFFNANKSILTSLDQGTSIKGFSKSDLENIELSFPCDNEQQKIANCLSSLDDLITAQSQKIEALKQHKKGLMQGLFPNTEEVGA